MSGGVVRAAGRSAFFKGPDVHHTHYFGHADSRAALDGWLGAQPGTEVPGFQTPHPPRVPAGRRAAGRGAAEIAGEVLLVPDIFASELRVDTQNCWPDVGQFALAGPERVLDEGRTQGQLVANYGPLLDALETRHQVTQWPWNPRRTLDAMSRRRELLLPSWSGITAIYGTAEQTVSGVSADGVFLTSSGGDGFTLLPSGRVRGPQAWYALVPHADLPVEVVVGFAVLDLLADRPPARLLGSPPAGPSREGLLADPRGRVLLPTPEEIVRTAWGGGRSGERPPILRVRVVHGDLRSAPVPVLVGHQDGTPVGGAEKALDSHLGGALDRRLTLGQYPGRSGTCEGRRARR